MVVSVGAIQSAIEAGALEIKPISNVAIHYCRVSQLCVRQILLREPGGGRVIFNRNYAFESAREWNCEQADAAVKLDSTFATRIAKHVLDQLRK